MKFEDYNIGSVWNNILDNFPKPDRKIILLDTANKIIEVKTDKSWDKFDPEKFICEYENINKIIAWAYTEDLIKANKKIEYKYYYRRKWSSGEYKFEKVKAKEFNFNEFDFFIFIEYSKFRIAEKKSGALVDSSMYNSETEAIENLKNIVKNKGYKEVKKAIEYNIKEVGAAPEPEEINE
jgi:hypothetical protein